jgi:hypothetical protein
MAVGNMVNDLFYGPPTLTIWSIKLGFIEVENGILK